MATVVIGAGSNLGDRLTMLKKSGSFLDNISEGPVRKSSVWESEPVGPAKYTFLNTVCSIETELSPESLLNRLKAFERSLGREEDPPRWSPRILDLDLISWNSLAIHKESLIIPHPEYQQRLFVLLPLQELYPNWVDPVDGNTINDMIRKAPDLRIKKTEFTW